MTNTEIALLATYRTPIVPLSEICERYFGCGIAEARRKANANLLKVPCWRLIDSQKAPLMVRLSDLAAFIDARAEEAQAEWTKSQV